ncbi:hypothetical protein B6N60_03731 [Richelia sinica FACHB-800]|uniref:Uncharacterized protein n=1 Tax=Richelia sinica FACHB-800 TaxID=1357546 RepID=A0A975Y685_9NOST|nr:hypothetical protein B6N60_03731 [Richelia sinica FACHB-800]
MIKEQLRSFQEINNLVGLDNKPKTGFLNLAVKFMQKHQTQNLSIFV